MREDQAYAMVCTLYATFGKSAPARGSAVFQTIFDRVADIQEEAAEYIVERLQDGDDLPKNLGKAIVAHWFNWQNENGITQEKKYCPMCEGHGAWECFRRVERNGKPSWIHIPFRCPRCTEGPDKDKLKPVQQLRREGWLVMPHNYPGGVIAFRREQVLGLPPIQTSLVNHTPQNIQKLLSGEAPTPAAKPTEECEWF